MWPTLMVNSANLSNQRMTERLWMGLKSQNKILNRIHNLPLVYPRVADLSSQIKLIWQMNVV